MASVKFSRNSEDISVTHHFTQLDIFQIGILVFQRYFQFNSGFFLMISVNLFHTNFSITESLILFNTTISTAYAAFDLSHEDISHHAVHREASSGLITHQANQLNHCSNHSFVSLLQNILSILSVERLTHVADFIQNLSNPDSRLLL